MRSPKRDKLGYAKGIRPKKEKPKAGQMTADELSAITKALYADAPPLGSIELPVPKRPHSTKSKKMPPVKPKEGRPTLYSTEEHPKVARNLTAEGKTKTEIAQILGIARSTLDEWRTNHVEFSVAFVLGVEDATDRVERSLLEKASGYTRKQEKLVTVAGPVGTGSQVERHLVEEHYPADTGAAKFWLTNRRKKQWSERSEVAVHGLEALVSRLAAARKRADEKTE